MHCDVVGGGRVVRSVLLYEYRQEGTYLHMDFDSVFSVSSSEPGTFQRENGKAYLLSIATWDGVLNKNIITLRCSELCFGTQFCIE